MMSLDPLLALVPARAGSKGVPGKNLVRLAGNSLTERAVRCAREAGVFARIAVSTDGDAIAAEAIRTGAEVIRRPPDLAGDAANVVDAIAHALDVLAADGFTPEAIVLLEPSSPLRTPGMIKEAVAALAIADAVFTVSVVPSRFHPRKQFRVDADGTAHRIVTDVAPPVRRQELAPTVVQNGAVYAFRTAMFLAHRSVLGPSPRALVISEPLVNVDTPADVAEARRLLARGRHR
jgi:CMP-N-acetylneuraminic acid synthetase